MLLYGVDGRDYQSGGRGGGGGMRRGMVSVCGLHAVRAVCMSVLPVFSNVNKR